MPTLGTPTSSASQGKANYLPNNSSDGGVLNANGTTGYKGYLTAEGKKVADEGGTFNVNGVNDSYLIKPEDLGFFTKKNWNGTTYPADKTNTAADDITKLFAGFDPQKIQVIWYTVKYDSTDGYHVDGYVAGAPVKVTYHSNYGTIPNTTEGSHVVNALSGDKYTVQDNMFAVPTGYTFGGWYADSTKYEVKSEHTLISDLHLYAKWNPKPYTVTWKNSDDAVDSLDTQAVNYNGYPTKDPRDQASKASDAQYTYEFKGVKLKDDKTDTIVEPKERAATENVTYVAVFTPITRQYTVTYYIDGEKQGDEKTYNYGTLVKIRDNAVKEDIRSLAGRLVTKMQRISKSRAT